METKAKKAVRYIAEGRLTVQRIDEASGLIVAECKGGGEVYRLGFDPRKSEWRCTCDASAKFSRTCSHLTALQLVTAKGA